MKLTSQRDWFQLSGQARLDGGLVLAFETCSKRRAARAASSPWATAPMPR
jgi:hypothetical protein